MGYFKLLPTRFAIELAEEGRGQITTLRTCRQNESKAGRGRSDPREGYKEVDLNFGLFRLLGPGEGIAEEWVKQGFTRDERLPVPAASKAACVQQLHTSNDIFLYCVSSYRSRRMERRFAAGDDYSWIEIFDPDGFFGALDVYMRSLGHTPKGISPVEYRSRRFRIGESPREAIRVKDPWFAPENETRAIWAPCSEPILPIAFKLPDLTKFCRLDRKVVPRIDPETKPVLRLVSRPGRP